MAITASQAVAQELPRSTIAVRGSTAWETWWRSDQAPSAWRAADPVLERAVRWHAAGPGVEWGEVSLAGSAEAWRTRLVLVRLDPRAVRLRLVRSVRAGGERGGWTVETAPRDAVVAVNAGQFTGASPWGWLVQGGVERQEPGRGLLSMAVVVDTAGAVRLVPADRIETVRADGAVAEAFQSYPALLWGNGEVPLALRTAGRGVDLGHRDSRVAIGELRDGRILVALTRFEGLGGALEALPFGPTVPELAALMGALGCRAAVALDGGLSGQMLVRDADGRTRSWPGLRRVPLALLVTPLD